MFTLRTLTEVEPEVLRCLDEAWKPARSAGAIGRTSLEALRWHASGFVQDHWRALPTAEFIDCGAGAGVVGVLLALELPRSRWTLVDASERRCELAQRAIGAASLADRVLVEHALVEDVAHRREARGVFDGMVARLFGPAAELAECGLPLLRVGGTLVVSVSSATRRQWQRMPLLESTGCEFAGHWTTPYGGFVSVRRVGPAPSSLPRRRAVRRRSPLL